MIDPSKPAVSVDLNQPVAPKSRFIHLTTKETCTVRASDESTVYIKWDESGIETDYGIEYFDRVFNPVTDVKLPNDKD